MANKPSGLGRGLGDLLEDNNPSARSQKPSVVLRAEDTPQKNNYSPYQEQTKSLYETKVKNKSVKANFKK